MKNYDKNSILIAYDEGVIPNVIAYCTNVVDEKVNESIAKDFMNVKLSEFQGKLAIFGQPMPYTERGAVVRKVLTYDESLQYILPIKNKENVNFAVYNIKKVLKYSFQCEEVFDKLCTIKQLEEAGLIGEMNSTISEEEIASICDLLIEHIKNQNNSKNR